MRIRSYPTNSSDSATDGATDATQAGLTLWQRVARTDRGVMALFSAAGLMGVLAVAVNWGFFAGIRP
jgi:hypothetical protein